LSDCFDYTIAASGGWAEVDNQDLVLPGVDDFSELLFQAQQIDGIELAFEDGILQVIAPVSQGLKNFAKPFIVADVVGNQVDVAHDGMDRAGIFAERNA
jgi:hypothetical protein